LTNKGNEERELRKKRRCTLCIHR